MGRTASRARRLVVRETDITGCFDVYLGDSRIGSIIHDLNRSWAAYTVDSAGYPVVLLGWFPNRRAAVAAVRDHGSKEQPA